jgi:hypothetical protein
VDGVGGGGDGGAGCQFVRRLSDKWLTRCSNTRSKCSFCASVSESKIVMIICAKSVIFIHYEIVVCYASWYLAKAVLKKKICIIKYFSFFFEPLCACLASRLEKS